MQITRLKIKNFLSVSDVEILPGKVTQIAGQNNSGKTTVLRAIEFALKGSTDGSQVKHGTDQAEVMIEFDDSTVIHRRLKPTGTQTVSVASGDKKLEKPQQFLNQLFTTSTFNPLSLLDPDLRTEALLKCIPIQVTESVLSRVVGDGAPIPLPPLDYSQHGLKVADQAHRYFYQRRYEANKIAKDKAEIVKVKRDELPEIPQLDPEYNRPAVTQSLEVVRKQIIEEESKRAVVKHRIGEFEKLRQKVEEHSAVLEIQRKRVRDLEASLIEARTRLEASTEANVTMVSDMNAAEETLSVGGPDQKKLTNLTGQVAELNNMMTHIERRDSILTQHAAITELDTDAKNAQLFADQLDMIVKNLGDSFRERLLREVELPVQGLSYSEGKFTLEGSSLDNLSTSKSIRLAVALARKLSAQTKIVCIDGVEALDAETFEMFEKEIANDGFSYFLTTVGDGFVSSTAKTIRMEGGGAH